jgi:hypothetical protein
MSSGWPQEPLVIAIGGLVIAKSLTFNPQDVKDELERDLAAIPAPPGSRRPEARRVPPRAPQQRIVSGARQGAHTATWNECMAGSMKPRILELEAKKTVPPFLARCKDPSKPDR